MSSGGCRRTVCRKNRGASVGHLHHGMADNLVPDAVSLLEHLRHDVFAERFVLDVGHRVVQGRVERVAHGAHLGDVQFPEGAAHFVLHQVNPLAEILHRAVLLRERTLEVVGDHEKPSRPLTASAVASA